MIDVRGLGARASHKKDHCLPPYPDQRRGHAVAGSTGDVIPVYRIWSSSRFQTSAAALAGSREPFDTNNARVPSGGARRDRTDDLMLAKHALSQLSYGPTGEADVAVTWWAWDDSNVRP